MKRNIPDILKKFFFNKHLKIILAIIIISISIIIVYQFNYSSENGLEPQTGFRWDMAQGEEIDVIFSQHPYVEAIINKLPDFEKETGIRVNYSIIPEEYYFDKLSTTLRKFRGPDVFMVGPYYIWEYSAKGYIQNLNYLLKRPEINDPAYDIDDFHPTVLNSFRWDTYPGHSVGTGGLWGVPMGFEVYSLAYNKRIFNERGLEPPHTMEDLLALCETLNEFDGKGTYALALRGTKSWATINTGYITTFANYGGKDFRVENGKLVSTVNSKESIAMNDMWVRLIKTGGAPTWEKYDWYQASADLGAGKAAMLFDADNVAYYQNPVGESKEAGNIAWIKAPLPEGRKVDNSSLWTWGLSISSATKHKEAAWIFLQYFTGKEYTLWALQNFKVVDPARKSLLESKQFEGLLSDAEGYSEVLSEALDVAEIQFTPQPYIYKVSKIWAEAIQDIVSGKAGSTKEGLDSLKLKIDDIVKDIKVQ